MKRHILIITIILIILCSCKTKDKNFIIQNDPVQITGNIVDFKGLYKTGKLIYFDAVTRIENNKIFIIDSLGNFKISFEIPHPIIGSIYFNLDNNVYSDFYIEPNVNYNVTINGFKLFFNGETGIINNEISSFKDSLYAKLGKKMDEANSLHNNGLSIEEYLSFQKQFENEKMKFLNNYNKNHPLSKKIFHVLESDIRYKTAHAWINYRFDYSTPGKRILRDTLPPDFYKRLFKEYPINEQEDFQSRICIDYISNIVSVIEETGNSVEKKISYFNSLNLYSQKELELLKKYFNGDTEISNSDDFKEFKTQKNMDKIRELYLRSSVNNLLEEISKYTPNVGRDLIVSQAISRYYISNNFRPTSSEWELIDKTIGNKSILKYLQTLSIQKTSEEQKGKIEDKPLEKRIKGVKAKYIDKHLGKVVYVDFYSTWCGPCREEIPFAKALQIEFKNTDVVFLNLCAQSKKEDWENLIKQEEIGGVNCLLANEESNLLAKLYNIEGFPTYVLIDKKGQVSNYFAPRPSSKKEIVKELNKLLE